MQNMCTRCGFLVVGVGRLVLIFLISRHYENKKVWLHNGYFGYLQRCRGCGVEWGSFMWGRLPWEITRVHPVLHFSTHMPQRGGCKVDFALSSTQVFILPTLPPPPPPFPSLLGYVKSLEIVRYQNKGRKPFQNEIGNRAIKNKNCQW